MKSTIACRLFSATLLFFTGRKKDKDIIIHCGGGCFFYRKGPGHGIFKLSVDRGYRKTLGEIQLAGRGIWECYTGCTDVVNDEYFRLLLENRSQTLEPYIHRHTF